MNTADPIATMVRELDKQGVTVDYAPLEDDVAVWDGPRGTITVDDAALETDQQWALIQLWLLLTIGPEASAKFQTVE